MYEIAEKKLFKLQIWFNKTLKQQQLIQVAYAVLLLQHTVCDYNTTDLYLSEGGLVSQRSEIYYLVYSLRAEQ